MNKPGPEPQPSQYDLDDEQLNRCRDVDSGDPHLRTVFVMVFIIALAASVLPARKGESVWLMLFFMLTFGVLFTFPVCLIITGLIWHAFDSFYKKSDVYARYQAYLSARSAWDEAVSSWNRSVQQEEVRKRTLEAARQQELQRIRLEEERRQLEAEEELARRKRDYWFSLSGYRLEHELSALYRKLGYDATVTRGSGDEGVDIWLTRDGKTTVVQCKAHKKAIGPAAVRDLYGVLLHNRASEAILVSLSGFTSGAENFADGKPIRLIDVDDIISIQEEARKRA